MNFYSLLIKVYLSTRIKSNLQVYLTKTPLNKKLVEFLVVANRKKNLDQFFAGKYVYEAEIFRERQARPI